MISGLVAPTTYPWSAFVMDPDLPICPDCSGKLKHGLAIARFIDRPDIRFLVCQQCHHVHWFAIEDGALRKL